MSIDALRYRAHEGSSFFANVAPMNLVQVRGKIADRLVPLMIGRVNDPAYGQVGSNAVNLEHKASKVFRPKAAHFAEVSRESPPFE
jgi:hypothetical protein